MASDRVCGERSRPSQFESCSRIPPESKRDIRSLASRRVGARDRSSPNTELIALALFESASVRLQAPRRIGRGQGSDSGATIVHNDRYLASLSAKTETLLHRS